MGDHFDGLHNSAYSNRGKTSPMNIKLLKDSLEYLALLGLFSVLLPACSSFQAEVALSNAPEPISASGTY